MHLCTDRAALASYYGGGGGGEKDAANPAMEDEGVESRNLKSLMQLTSALEHLTCAVSKVGGKGASTYHQQVMQ